MATACLPLGSLRRRFDYTVIGDAVNVGARLEGLNRLFGTTILVSGETYRACEAADGVEKDLHFREVATTRVKGREDPVRVYELMPLHLYPDRERLRIRFQEALALYHDEDFAAADAFTACQRLAPDDGPSDYYLHQCHRCLTDPAAYRAVIRQTTK